MGFLDIFKKKPKQPVEATEGGLVALDEELASTKALKAGCEISVVELVKRLEVEKQLELETSQGPGLSDAAVEILTKLAMMTRTIPSLKPAVEQAMREHTSLTEDKIRLLMGPM